MRFDLDEEQRLLADSVRRFVSQDYGFEARKAVLASARGHSEAAWHTLAELGLLALPLPEAHGGFGRGAMDLVPAMEAFGEALVLEPYLATVMAARMVARGGEALQAAVLPAVAEGAMVLAFAHTEDGSRYDLAHVATRAVREGAGYRIDGVKRAVLHAPQAGRLLVTARSAGGVDDEGGLCLFAVEASAAGIAMRPFQTLDGFRGADVTFSGVRVDGGARIGEEGAAFPIVEEAVDWATALACAEAVGAMRSANDATLEYLKTRKQFGVAIGTFQALQHRMVDMVIEAEQARSMAALACATVDATRDAATRRRLVSAAKIKIAEAARRVSQESVQLHGGMGMTEELKVSHTFRRLTMLAQQWGDAAHHFGRYAREDPQP